MSDCLNCIEASLNHLDKWDSAKPQYIDNFVHNYFDLWQAIKIPAK